MKKPSKTIDVKSVLDDIKAGMSDSALMEKHKLSAVGLESLLRKLYESSTIRQIRAMEVVRDFVAAMPEGRLMDKYALSEEILNKFSEHQEREPFLNKPAEATAKPRKGVFLGREIIHDLRSGMTRWDLMLKYKLSGAQLKKALEVILEERRRVALEIAADVRSGATYSELMQKYQLSNSGLQNVCQKFLTEGLLGPADIQGLKLPSHDAESAQNDRRQISRRSPSLPIMVCDMCDGGSIGTIKDITEKGLAVKGIEAAIGEPKTLWVLGDDYGLIDSFELEAQCRWVEREGSEGQSVAGFQVIAISDEDLQKLRGYIKFLDLVREATS